MSDKTVHGYNSTTFQYEYSILIDETAYAEYEHVTLVEPPEVHPSLEVAIFDAARQSWSVGVSEDFLNGHKVFYRARVDRLAASKIKDITSQVAQNSDLYRLKYDESVKYINDSKPSDLTLYPFLSAGVTASGISASDYADLVISKYENYINELVVIETARLNDNIAIDGIVYNPAISAEDYEILFKDILDEPSPQLPPLS